MLVLKVFCVFNFHSPWQVQKFFNQWKFPKLQCLQNTHTCTCSTHRQPPASLSFTDNQSYSSHHSHAIILTHPTPQNHGTQFLTSRGEDVPVITSGIHTPHSIASKWTDIPNVGRTLVLGLPRKQNGHPIGYITVVSIVSPLKRGVQRLWRLFYGLLPTAMLVEPLIGVKDHGKGRNRRVAKSLLFS